MLSHIPCSTLQVETPEQAPPPSPPGQLRMAVSLVVSLCFLGAVTLNYPVGEAMPHLHQMVSHINITVS